MHKCEPEKSFYGLPCMLKDDDLAMVASDRSNRVDFIQRRTNWSCFFQVENAGFGTEVALLGVGASATIGRAMVSGGGRGLRTKDSRSKHSRAEIMVVRQRG